MINSAHSLVYYTFAENYQYFISMGDGLKIWSLIKLEAKVEFRNRYLISSILFFIFIYSYVTYSILGENEILLYQNALWIVVLVVNTLLSFRVFSNLTSEERTYISQSASAIHILISKYLFNAFLLFIGSFVLFGVGFLWHPSATVLSTPFVVLLFFAALAFSSTFTLPAALTINSSGKTPFLGIISYPISIPILLISHRLGVGIVSNSTLDLNGIFMLISISILMFVASLYLVKFVL